MAVNLTKYEFKGPLTSANLNSKQEEIETYINNLQQQLNNKVDLNNFKSFNPDNNLPSFYFGKHITAELVKCTVNGFPDVSSYWVCVLTLCPLNQTDGIICQIGVSTSGILAIRTNTSNADIWSNWHLK